jgi:hypothetical protein
MARRRRALLAGIGALTATGAALAFAGLHAVRTSTAGRYEQVAGPDDPGYQAYVVPTPTMGVMHRGADGGLVGVALLALEPDDDGGSVIAVPTATVVPGGDDTIADAYADRGLDAASDALGLTVGVGVADVVEVDDAQWGRLVEPAGPVEVTLDEPLADWPAGPVELGADDVGPFLSALGEGETELDRLDRQQAFWNAWLPLVGDEGAGALPGEVGTGIGRFVLGVARGEGGAAALPVVPVLRVAGGDGDAGGGPGPVRFQADDARLGELVSRTVPYPVGPRPGDRIRVRLLNGTDDRSVTTLAARTLVAGGAQISIVGNASSFDVTDTTVVYAGDERARAAESLSDVLGGGRVEEASSGQDGQVSSDDEIDVTVILGDDAEDLIGEVTDPD